MAKFVMECLNCGKYVEASRVCAQCGIKLRTNKAAKTFTCPVCDFENDVQARLAQEGLLGNGSVAGGLGEFAALGMGLGAMGSVIGMTRDAMPPSLNAGTQMGQSIMTPGQPVEPVK